VTPGLSDLELGLAGAVPVADADLVVREAVDGQVLPELAVAEVIPPEVLLPVPVGLDLVDQYGALLAAVARQATFFDRPTFTDSSTDGTVIPALGRRSRPG
jgi:hypothetical protein